MSCALGALGSDELEYMATEPGKQHLEGWTLVTIVPRDPEFRLLIGCWGKITKDRETSTTSLSLTTQVNSSCFPGEYAI